MDDVVGEFVELLESDLPEWLPRPQREPGVEAAWFRATRPLEEFGARLPGEELEVFACRTGDGGAPPYVVTFLTCSRSGPTDTPRPRWPRLEDVWAGLGELCLEGAIFQLPAHVTGERFQPSLEGAVVTVLTAAQVGAVSGSPAHVRFSLASRPPVGLVQ